MIQCSRCRLLREGLAAPPFREGTALGPLGRTVHERVCADCWRAWLAFSVKVLNEAKLGASDPQAQSLWLTQMRAFLGFDGGSGDPWGRFLDQRVRIELLRGTTAIATVVTLDRERLHLADVEGGVWPEGVSVIDTHRNGASVLRDEVIVIEPVQGPTA